MSARRNCAIIRAKRDARIAFNLRYPPRKRVKVKGFKTWVEKERVVDAIDADADAEE